MANDAPTPKRKYTPPAELTQKPCRMVSLRSVRISSVFGETILMKANEPTDVPGRLVAEATALGCVPYNEAEYHAHVANKQVEAVEAQNREDRLVDAVHALVVRNERSAFTSTGLPRVEALAAEVDLVISEAERDKAFATWRARNRRPAAAEKKADEA